MRAPYHALIVTPTGDTSEVERGRLVVVNSTRESDKVFRGVVEDVGPHMEQPGLEQGAVAFYSSYVEVLDWHVVSQHHFLCFEPADS